VISAMTNRPADARINADLLRSVTKTGRGWWATVIVAGIVFLAAVFAFCCQLYWGIGVWGINRPIMWALATAGSAGVARALRLLREETERALALLGVRSPDELDRRYVSRVG